VNGLGDGGQVVALFDEWGSSRAGLCRGTAESVEYLDAYLPVGYRNGVATSVATDGITTRVGGYADNNPGYFEAIVWTHVVPEPGTFAALAAALAAGLALLARRRRA